jgi:purine-nucleoside phosphorylase
MINLFKKPIKTAFFLGDPKRVGNLATEFGNLQGHNVVSIGNNKQYQAFVVENSMEVFMLATSGMGIASIWSVLEFVLQDCPNLEYIVRIGTCGGFQASTMQMGDWILATTAMTDSEFIKKMHQLPVSAGVAMSSKLLRIIQKQPPTDRLFYGPIYSTDLFYGFFEEKKMSANNGYLGVDMETYALYALANQYNLRAASFLAVSDFVFEPTGGLMPDTTKEMLGLPMIQYLNQLIKNV